MTARGEENLFLLQKIRTYLFGKGIKAKNISGFEKCIPLLQAQLAGWHMDLGATLLFPARDLTAIDKELYIS